jgi:hypothetical protein
LTGGIIGVVALVNRILKGSGIPAILEISMERETGWISKACRLATCFDIALDMHTQ